MPFSRDWTNRMFSGDVSRSLYLSKGLDEKVLPCGRHDDLEWQDTIASEVIPNKHIHINDKEGGVNAGGFFYFFAVLKNLVSIL